MNTIYIVLIIFFSFVLIKSADMVVVAVRRLSKGTRAGMFAISAVILAIGTSFPELFVGTISAMEGASSLSFGIVMGSNIANISLVAGFSAFLAGRVRVQGSFLKRDVGIALLAGVLPVFLILDGTLSRVDGFILLAVYGAYASGFFRARFMQIAEEQRKESFFYRFLRNFSLSEVGTKEYGKLFIGIALLLLSSDIIVRIAKLFAEASNIPVFIVGLILLAIGTSLPELAFSLRSLIEHEQKMFFGNLLGSTIANSTLVIGASAVITPVTEVGVSDYTVAGAAFLLIFLTFWYFIRTKRRLDRWEAFMLFLLYVIFVVVEFM